MAGTASIVARWLFLEQPGAWPPTALESLRLPGGLGAELARRANQSGVRIVLLRRPGRPLPQASGAGPRCYVAHVRPEGSWLGEVPLTTATDVLDLDLRACTAGPSASVETVRQPLFCVCTHGRHDACCAERGRPVAAAIAAAYPEQTWEVSHIGGDRFAANLVCFPDGDYLGRLTATDAAHVAGRYLDGHYTLRHLRGRCSLRPPVQAAEVLVRRRLGVDARGGVRILGWQRDGDRMLVSLRVHDNAPVTAHVRIAPSTPARRLTCSVLDSATPPSYELVELS